MRNIYRPIELEAMQTQSKQKLHAANLVCAAIVSYNGKTVIEKTIRALKHQVEHVLIIDNNSQDGTIEILNKVASEKNTSVIYNEHNEGVGSALNKGVKFAKKNGFTWLLTMDQDSIADPDMIEELLSCAAHYSGDEKTVSFSPRIINDRIHSTVENDEAGYEDRYSVITSGNLLKVAVFERVGLYNEQLFIDSVDFDFCLRLRKSGCKIIRTHRAKLYHSLGQVVSRNFFGAQIALVTHSPVRKYYILRNHIYITKKYFARFPFFCLRKQFGMVRIILQSIFLERRKAASMKFFFKALQDGLLNRLGSMENPGANTKAS